ncbi:EAL domain-containing protein [Mycolicibacterium sarraceniae]|uniref:EAL domain-containing protein n=1 Tax=Mycolicibacterium sarraceniae TaxID=1534348 RepID=UPI0013D5E482|nr:EAL domain-containing protein [Mycolicibacterium sarraceniae]
MARSEFRIAYQPVVNSSTGACFGLEARVRWRVGDEEIPAEKTISLAEGAGQIGPLRSAGNRTLALSGTERSSSLVRRSCGRRTSRRQERRPNAFPDPAI